MPEVIRVLRQEHANLDKLIKTLERQIDLFERGEEPDYDLIDGIVDYFLSFPDLYHHPKENLVLAKLAERDPAAAERVGDLQSEHEEIANRTRDFATCVRYALEQTNGPRNRFHNSAREFMRYQREHMENEERVFFPAALHALTDEDWADLEARMTDQEDPLFGDNVGERYEALHMDILRWEREERTT